MLTQIVTAAAEQMGVNTVIASKLVHFIDVQKLKGLTGGQAASRFADYLGFLRLPDDAASHEFFASRWNDHLVRIPITPELEKYSETSTPIFTRPRLEPVFNKTPFYNAGLTKVETGVTRNPEDGGSVRKPPPSTISYSNFIIEEFVPAQFYFEIHNEQVEDFLTNGLKALSGEAELQIYPSAHDAHANLVRDLRMRGNKITHALLGEHTLVSIASEKMQLNNDVFYTKHLSQNANATYGYFYTGGVPAAGCAVAENKLK